MTDEEIFTALIEGAKRESFGEDIEIIATSKHVEGVYLIIYKFRSKIVRDLDTQMEIIAYKIKTPESLNGGIVKTTFIKP